jgi:uncharacterized protein (TIGR04255 family)
LRYKLYDTLLKQLGAKDLTVQLNNTKQLSYDQPPVTEVACSVLFNSIDEILTSHIGLLWGLFQPEYPFSDDVVPIAPRIELFGNPVIETEVELNNVPALPRVWFISSDETRIIQIQRDRLIHNWRKLGSDSEYPRYDSIIQAFQEHLSTFDTFLRQSELGQIEPVQYEIIYVNKIPQGEAWKTFEDIGKIFPDFAWRTDSQRFLSEPKTINWITTFELPDEIGRLYVVIRHTIDEENHPLLLFELTVRGIGSHSSFESMKSWFDIAHAWVVQAFADLTAEIIQTEIWKRKR